MKKDYQYAYQNLETAWSNTQPHTNLLGQKFILGEMVFTLKTLNHIQNIAIELEGKVEQQAPSSESERSEKEEKSDPVQMQYKTASLYVERLVQDFRRIYQSIETDLKTWVTNRNDDEFREFFASNKWAQPILYNPKLLNELTIESFEGDLTIFDIIHENVKGNSDSKMKLLELILFNEARVVRHIIAEEKYFTPEDFDKVFDSEIFAHLNRENVEVMVEFLRKHDAYKVKATFYYAKYLYSTGNYEDAAKELNNFPEDNDFTVKAKLYKALCYEALGKIENAKELFDSLSEGDIATLPEKEQDLAKKHKQQVENLGIEDRKSKLKDLIEKWEGYAKDGSESKLKDFSGEVIAQLKLLVSGIESFCDQGVGGLKAPKEAVLKRLKEVKYNDLKDKVDHKVLDAAHLGKLFAPPGNKKEVEAYKADMQHINDALDVIGQATDFGLDV